MTNKTGNQKHYERLLKNGTVEVRCIDKSGRLKKGSDRPVIWSGLFDSWDYLRTALLHGDKMGWDVYTTINPAKAPALNEALKPYQRTTKDSDISRIKTIFFDFDTEDKTADGSCAESVQAAVDLACELVVFLYDYGWGAPTLANSGNGAHLQYAVDLDVDVAKSLHGLYAGLALRFSRNNIGFDVSVKNPARICRAYGTTNRKGGNRSECEFSDDFTDTDAVLNTIQLLTPPKPKSTWVQTDAQKPVTGKFVKNMDIVGLFKSAGLYRAPSSEGGKHFVECINKASHSCNGTTDTVIWEGEWAQYKCSHAGCANLNISDVIETLGASK